MKSPLPYRDVKPVGAADFYFAINATFRFIEKNFGTKALRQYWTDLGLDYYAPVSEPWKRNGLNGIANYWKAFFAAEPGAEVDVQTGHNSVVLNVRTCPAIKHLRDHHRTITPSFCQHCYFVNKAVAEKAGFTVRVEGGNGDCRQTFVRQGSTVPAQDLTRIKEAK